MADKLNLVLAYRFGNRTICLTFMQIVAGTVYLD
jgi:hypothetical protein